MLDEVNERYFGKHGIIKLSTAETLFLKCILDNYLYKSATKERLIDYIYGNLETDGDYYASLTSLAYRLKKKMRNEFIIANISKRGYCIR